MQWRITGKILSHFSLTDVQVTLRQILILVLIQAFLTCSPDMVRWVVGSILHRVNPLSYFSFQPVLHNLCNKGRGMVHIKEPLLLIEKSSPCGGSRFPISLSEWSFTICLTPYNRK